MSGRRNRILPALILLALTNGLVGREPGAWSPRNANYTIQARLDAARKTVEGKGGIELAQ